MAFQHICLYLFFSSLATTIYISFSFLFLVNCCLNAFIDMSFSNDLVFLSHRFYKENYIWWLKHVG